MSAPEEQKKLEELGIPEGVIKTENFDKDLHTKVGSQLGTMEDLTSSEQDPVPAFGKEVLVGHPTQWQTEKIVDLSEKRKQKEEQKTNSAFKIAGEVHYQANPTEGLDVNEREGEGEEFYNEGLARAQAMAKKHGLELIVGGKESALVLKEEEKKVA